MHKAPVLTAAAGWISSKGGNPNAMHVPLACGACCRNGACWWVDLQQGMSAGRVYPTMDATHTRVLMRVMDEGCC